MLRVKTVGVHSNRDGIGTKVVLQFAEWRADITSSEVRLKLSFAERASTDIWLGKTANWENSGAGYYLAERT